MLPINNINKIRPKSSIQPIYLRRISSFQKFKLNSSIFESRITKRKTKEADHEKYADRINQSKLDSWRIVCAARCEKYLTKQQVNQPLRKNLSQKKIRILSKRQQQQQKYQNLLAIIKKKCQLTSKFMKNNPKQARQTMQKWEEQRKLQNLRYQKRLERLKR